MPTPTISMHRLLEQSGCRFTIVPTARAPCIALTAGDGAPSPACANVSRRFASMSLRRKSHAQFDSCGGFADIGGGHRNRVEHVSDEQCGRPCANLQRRSKRPFYANATGFCHGILFGSYRFYDSWVSAEKRFVCPPTPAQTRAEVMNGFVAWARSHPQYMKDAAVDTLFRYLAEAYPCKK